MRILVVSWLLFLVALSLAPLEIKARLHTLGRLHDFGHLVAFLLTALLFCWTAQTTRSKLLRLAGMLGLAVLLEGLETLVYKNRLEWGDVVLDAAGMLVGFGLLQLRNLYPRGYPVNGPH